MRRFVEHRRNACVLSRYAEDHAVMRKCRAYGGTTVRCSAWQQMIARQHDSEVSRLPPAQSKAERVAARTEEVCACKRYGR